jgi:hypothetical protein
MTHSCPEKDLPQTTRAQSTHVQMMERTLDMTAESLDDGASDSMTGIMMRWFA